MCGIVGKFALNSHESISPDLIQRMICIVQHRGPDECGVYVDDAIGLGHTRLSIIDLAGGVQPIHNEDQSLWIIYNGEVYNYVELKKGLVEKGHQFYTDTDTEVLLHLYEEEGHDCLNQLNGQFAFAIWDSIKKELFLARDRLGIRPLFYTQTNGAFIFASEIKALFMEETVSRALDSSAINEIFTFWTTLPGKTVFKNIFELPPGHYLKASDSKMDVKKYWHPPFSPPEEQIDWPIDQIVDRIQELLVDAVRLRLRADVPVGCYLSGGLDSSGVTTLVVNNFDNHVKTFGIRFEQTDFDEGQYQQQMVNFLGVEHSEVFATNESIGTSLSDVLWHCEKPLLRTAPIPLFLLSDRVHQNGYKVVLTGEGADEVFGGYNIFREAKIRKFWARQPDSIVRGSLIARLYPYIFNDPKLFTIQRAFFASGLDKVDHPFFSHLIRWQNTSKIKTFLSQDLHNDLNALDYSEKLLEHIPASFTNWDYLSKAQYVEMILFLSHYLLSSQGDRVAMAHSVEIRLPYLDYRIIDFMGRVPAKFKIRGLQEKYILKKSFQNILPETIANRPKHPYRAPIGQSLFQKNLSEKIESTVTEKSLKKSGIFDAHKVHRLFHKFKTVDNPSEVEHMALLGIVSTQQIHQQFIVDFPFQTGAKATPTVFINKQSS